MRPAALPPSAYTDPQINQTTPPTPCVAADQLLPGQLHGGPRRAESVALPGFRHQRHATPPGSNPASIPASHFSCRRPSRSAGCSSRRTLTPTAATRACHEQRERAGGSVHQQPQPQPDAPATVATGGLPPFHGPGADGTGTTYSVNDGVVNLFWVPGGTACRSHRPRRR